jgi:hypothetical protein
MIPFVVAASTALTAACARQSAPSGGPVDRRPPVIVGVEPDTFARIEAGDGSIRIRFDEAISENPATGTLDQAIQVSPRTGDVEVRHRGDALEVRIEGGFVPGVVYRVTVLPLIRDRFQNGLLDPFEWVFSTGPDFEANALVGEVWDRITGEPVRSMDVFAVGKDSVNYAARTDSLGLFVMRYLPRADYRLESFDDRNQNGAADPFEVQGFGSPVSLGATDTLFTSFWVMVPDTTAPQVARGEKIDSTTVRLFFDDPLEPGQSLEGLIRGMYRDSGNTPGVVRALHAWQYDLWADSVAAVRAEVAAVEAAAEAATAAEAVAVEATAAEAVAPDTTAGVMPPPPSGAGRATEPPAEPEFLPDGQRIPETSVVLLLRGPIEGGALYTVLLGPIANISGLVNSESEGSFRLPEDPRRPTVDSATVDTAAADSLAPPDTAGVRLPPPDTVAHWWLR